MTTQASSQGEIVVGLDIGTTKVCAVVGEIGEDGITILGVGSVPCRGLRKGIVSNIDWTVRSIKDAIESAQTMAGVEIRTVYAGVAGSHIRSQPSDGIAAVAGGEVTRADVERALEGHLGPGLQHLQDLGADLHRGHAALLGHLEVHHRAVGAGREVERGQLVRRLGLDLGPAHEALGRGDGGAHPLRRASAGLVAHLHLTAGSEPHHGRERHPPRLVRQHLGRAVLDDAHQRVGSAQVDPGHPAAALLCRRAADLQESHQYISSSFASMRSASRSM